MGRTSESSEERKLSFLNEANCDRSSISAALFLKYPHFFDLGARIDSNDWYSDRRRRQEGLGRALSRDAVPLPPSSRSSIVLPLVSLIFSVLFLSSDQRGRT